LYQRAEYDRLVRFFASWQYQDQHLWDTGPGVSVSYLYDDNGIRVKKTAGGVATYYVSPIDEISGSTVTKYYYPSRPAGTRLRTSFGGQRIAMKKGGVLTYLHGDHHGSTVLETSSTGAITADQKYFAGACPELAEGAGNGIPARWSRITSSRLP
jgi:hypothetical protein